MICEDGEGDPQSDTPCRAIKPDSSQIKGALSSGKGMSNKKDGLANDILLARVGKHCCLVLVGFIDPRLLYALLAFTSSVASRPSKKDFKFSLFCTFPAVANFQTFLLCMFSKHRVHRIL